MARGYFTEEMVQQSTSDMTTELEKLKARDWMRFITVRIILQLAILRIVSIVIAANPSRG